jgi:hypothetical protein
VSSPCVHIKVHRPRRAISPRITKRRRKVSASDQQYGDLTIHKHGLSDVIGVMARNDVIHIQHCSSPVEGLPAKHATESAVVLFADLSDDGVHCPAVEVVVAQDFERH